VLTFSMLATVLGIVCVAVPFHLIFMTPSLLCTVVLLWLDVRSAGLHTYAWRRCAGRAVAGSTALPRTRHFATSLASRISRCATSSAWQSAGTQHLLPPPKPPRHLYLSWLRTIHVLCIVLLHRAACYHRQNIVHGVTGRIFCANTIQRALYRMVTVCPERGRRAA